MTEQISNEVQFKANRDITPEDKWEIFAKLSYIHNQAIAYKNPVYWEEFAINAKWVKLILPDEKIPLIDERSYKGIDNVSKIHLNKNNVGRHLNIAVAQKILFPDQWDLRWKDFHSDEIRWIYLRTILESFKLDKQWTNVYEFFSFAQNMKILAPERFESINLQKILGPTVWIEEIIEELELSKDHYANFTLFATPLHILEYPSKIDIEPYEWQEMEEQAQELKNEDILFFTEFSSRRQILAAKDIKITNKSFDLIF